MQFAIRHNALFETIYYLGLYILVLCQVNIIIVSNIRRLLQTFGF